MWVRFMNTTETEVEDFKLILGSQKKKYRNIICTDITW